MAPGTIILLNGTSSSGKTSIAHALQALMDEPFIHTGNDHFHAMFPQRFFVPSDGIHPAEADGFLLVFTGEVRTFETPEGRRGFAGGTLAEVRIGPAGLRLHAGMYRAVAALASAGNNVIVDTVIHDPRVLRMAVEELSDTGALFVGVCCPLAVAQARETARGDRARGGATAFSARVHAHGIYDLELDTSLLAPHMCALRIKEALDSGRPRTALPRLAQAIAAGGTTPGIVLRQD
jgi:chloramphenicol 3-O phosphotransferase